MDGWMDGSWVADDASVSCFDCAVAFLASLPARLVAVLPQNPNPLLLFLSNLHSIFFRPHHKQNSMNDIGVRHPWKGWEPESNWLILQIGSCHFSFAPDCQRHTEVHTYTATLHPPRQGSCGRCGEGMCDRRWELCQRRAEIHLAEIQNLCQSPA